MSRSITGAKGFMDAHAEIIAIDRMWSPKRRFVEISREGYAPCIPRSMVRRLVKMHYQIRSLTISPPTRVTFGIGRLR